MRVLITGGAGFIGSHLAEAHLERGDSVYVIDDLSTGNLNNVAHLRSNPQFGIAVETILNETVMDRLVSECDVIYHLAAAVGVELIVHDPVGTIETNILGTHAVLKLANRYLRRVLIASTSEIYGKSDKVPFAEDDDRILGPTSRSRWSYADSKAIDEYLAFAYHKQKNLQVTVARLFNTVGPRQTGRWGMVIPRMVRQALAGEPITVYGDGEQVRSFTFVKDTVRALMGLMDSPNTVGQIYNVGSQNSVSIKELAERIKKMTGSSSEIVFIPYEVAYEKGFEDMRVRVPDLSKIHAAIGYEPQYTLDDILQEVIRYFKEHPEAA